jgi:hypothetical protein
MTQTFSSDINKLAGKLNHTIVIMAIGKSARKIQYGAITSYTFIGYTPETVKD